MSPDPNISNGTCYIKPGVEGAFGFIPCGNAALGPKTCCHIGDWCLSSNACYNYGTGNTYLLGCSDPEYHDASCPDKGKHNNDPWVGLAYCGNDDPGAWVYCPQSAHPSTLKSPDPCECPDTSRDVAFTDFRKLDDIASLGDLGGPVTWRTPPFIETSAVADPVSGTTTTYHIVTSSLVPSSTLGTVSNSTNSSTPTFSPPTEHEAPPGSVLSADGKIGIGVGIGIGCTSLVVLSVLLLLSYRRKMKRKSQQEVDGVTEDPKSAGGPGRTGSTLATVPSELETTPRPWSPRSELDSCAYGSVSSHQSVIHPTGFVGSPVSDTHENSGQAGSCEGRTSSYHRFGRSPSWDGPGYGAAGYASPGYGGPGHAGPSGGDSEISPIGSPGQLSPLMELQG